MRAAQINPMDQFKNVPPWANWIAQDADGAWWAYEVEPLQQTTGWYENEVGRHQKLQADKPPEDWRARLLRVKD